METTEILSKTGIKLRRHNIGLVLTGLLSSLLLVIVSCRESYKSSGELESLAMRYATNITCERGDGFSVWTLRDPWDSTAVLHRYILRHIPDPSQDEGKRPQSNEEFLTQLPPSLSKGLRDAAIIQVPVRSAGVATAVHCGLLNELGCASAITGVCEKQYIDLPVVTEGLSNGHIADFGNGMNPNIERIIDVSPDVLLLTPFEHSGGYGRVERLGIPIIECAEYMEVSPLARAEWIRFYAELFGAEELADSIFSAVESHYLFLKQKASTTTERPRLLTEMLYGGQWFVPSGQSTMGIMFADAGADYLFSDLPGSGSTALAFEAVLDRAHDADCWLLKYNSPRALTYGQMASDYQPYTRFRAFTEHHIYGCDLAHNHFYEETPFHPDRLLRDLILILHPDLLPGEQPVYYHPLAE